MGIPEAWGIIFCCHQWFPVEEVDGPGGKKVEIIRKKMKCYAPFGKEYCTDSCNVTVDWIKDECTCGMNSMKGDMQRPAVLICKPLKGFYGTDGVEVPTGGGAPAAQEMGKAGGPTSAAVTVVVVAAP